MSQTSSIVKGTTVSRESPCLFCPASIIPFAFNTPANLICPNFAFIVSSDFFPCEPCFHSSGAQSLKSTILLVTPISHSLPLSAGTKVAFVPIPPGATRVIIWLVTRTAMLLTAASLFNAETSDPRTAKRRLAAQRRASFVFLSAFVTPCLLVWLAYVVSKRVDSESMIRTLVDGGGKEAGAWIMRARR